MERIEQPFVVFEHFDKEFNNEVSVAQMLDHVVDELESIFLGFTGVADTDSEEFIDFETDLIFLLDMVGFDLVISLFFALKSE